MTQNVLQENVLQENVLQENVFQENVFQVFLEEPSPRPPPPETGQEDPTNGRIHRWFGTVVNTRLLVTGVLQVVSAFACILATVTSACVSYSCSLSMTTPVWSSLLYLAAGALAMEVQRKATKSKIVSLVGLNLFSLLLGVSGLLANSLRATQRVSLSTNQQRVGSSVARGSSIVFSVSCFLASVYIVFLSLRGLRRYSPPVLQAYSRLPQVNQDGDETNGPLLGHVEHSQ